MTWAHPSDDLLRAFMTGEPGDTTEDEWVRLAEHLDDCPDCAARASVFDPMSLAYASAVDEPVPEGLVDDVFSALASPRRSASIPHRRTILMAGGLLASAAAVLVLAGAPGDFLIGLLTLGGALLATTVSLGAGLSSPVATATFVAGVGLAASVVTVRKANQGRRAA